MHREVSVIYWIFIDVFVLDFIVLPSALPLILYTFESLVELYFGQIL